MADNGERVCPYYVATVLGRHRSAVLCYDWGLGSGTLPLSRATVYFDSGALQAAEAVCRGDYEHCGEYRRMIDQQAQPSSGGAAGTAAMRSVIDAMMLDALRDGPDKTD